MFHEGSGGRGKTQGQKSKLYDKESFLKVALNKSSGVGVRVHGQLRVAT